MKIAILQCDVVREELEAHGQYPYRFAELLKPVCPKINFTIFNAEHGELPSDIHVADAYLITGSRYGVNDNLPWINTLEAFILTLHQAGKKIIGICFGHQLVAKALGGKVIKWPQGWGVGMSQNKILQDMSWMQPKKNQFNILASHQDQVAELPEGAKLLAKNDFCPNYMMQIDAHILTLQGHPEFTKGYSYDLMTYRKTVLGEEVYKKGVESLTLQEDSNLIAEWLVHFLQGN